MTETQTPQGTRYSLSFTSGALLMREALIAAPIYLRERDWTTVRQLIEEENLLQSRTRSSRSRLARVKQAAAIEGITLDVKFDGSIHDRSVVTDTGWRINLGCVLDIFQFVPNDAFDLAVKLQQYRQVKAFGVTYVRESVDEAVG